MGSETYFHGELRFARRLEMDELVWIEEILNAGRPDYDDKEMEAKIEQIAEEARVTREDGSLGPTVHWVPGQYDIRAQLRGFFVGPTLCAAFAGDLGITAYGTGLVHRAEKTHRMVDAVNFIITNARIKIPDFALKGELKASTDYEPYTWRVRIGCDGLAYQSTDETDLPPFEVPPPTGPNVVRRAPFTPTITKFHSAIEVGGKYNSLSALKMEGYDPADAPKRGDKDIFVLIRAASPTELLREEALALGKQLIEWASEKPAEGAENGPRNDDPLPAPLLLVHPRRENDASPVRRKIRALKRFFTGASHPAA